MTAPSSSVEICTLAADLIKATEVNSLDDPQEVVEAMAARWWDASRRQALKMVRPNFAKKRDSIPRNSTAPAFEFTDQYVLPNDYIILIAIRDLDTPLSLWNYSIEGDNILMNNGETSTLPIIYVFDETNVGRWDPTFKKAVAFELAINICYGMTGQKTLTKLLMEARSMYLAETRALNGQEKPPKYNQHSPARSARFRYTAGPKYLANRTKR